MTKYQEIIDASAEVDGRWAGENLQKPIIINYSVPASHPRHEFINSYTLNVQPISQIDFRENDLVFIDKGVQSLIDIKNKKTAVKTLEAIEAFLKEIHNLEKIAEQFKENKFQRVIGIGGGIICNISTYIAEQLKTDLILAPTTIIAMADASIGGKVRVNKIEGDRFIKHFYKTVYEPSRVIIDPIFLSSLSDNQVRVGLSEIIKHGLYQSDGLVEYLLSGEFQPFSDKQSLLKAILWVADLKRVCLEKDPEETKDGCYFIIRAAHDISDKIEEESKFTISHGQAVLQAMVMDLKNKPEKFNLLKELYKKFGIDENVY